MDKEDLIVDLQMYFNQIKDLSNLMIETNRISTPNLVTISDLADLALGEISTFNEA